MTRPNPQLRHAPEPITRREALRFGAAGLGGVGLRLGASGLELTALPGLACGADPQKSAAIPGFGKAKSVLVIYASGGQSQLDMWDLKPEAPAEVRGAFSTIATSIPGVRFGEHMPRLARVADRMTIVRSMSHEDTDHGSAMYLALTGHYHVKRSANPPPQPSDHPTHGAILKRVLPAGKSPYAAVHLNGPALVPELPAPGQDGGFLGYGYDPLLLGDVTNASTPLRDLEPLDDVTAARLATRRTLLSAVEQGIGRLEANPAYLEMQGIYRQAYELLAKSETRHAFDLSKEPDAVRDRYGRNRSGQACLLARRLVEAEVPWVTVVWCPSNRGQDAAPGDTDRYGWDTHNDIFEALEQHLLPRFDQGFSALLEDLDARGLLDTTLVVCMGEFGRAPLVALEPRFAGATPGRKHWASVYSIAMAGAGVSRGAVYGASDRHGGNPKTTPVGPWDVAATMFSALGVDPAGHYVDATGRPFPIATGRPIEGLYC